MHSPRRSPSTAAAPPTGYPRLADDGTSVSASPDCSAAVTPPSWLIVAGCGVCSPSASPRRRPPSRRVLPALRAAGDRFRLLGSRALLRPERSSISRSSWASSAERRASHGTRSRSRPWPRRANTGPRCRPRGVGPGRTALRVIDETARVLSTATIRRAGRRRSASCRVPPTHAAGRLHERERRTAAPAAMSLRDPHPPPSAGQRGRSRPRVAGRTRAAGPCTWRPSRSRPPPALVERYRTSL